MPMTPRQLANWLRSSHYQRAHDDFERGLALLDRATTHPDVRLTPGLSREALSERRAELLSELGAIDAALKKHEGVRAGLHAAPLPPGSPSLETSE